MIVNERIAPVTPEHGDGGGVNTTARTPPVARAAATRATIMISLVLNNTTRSNPDIWSPRNYGGLGNRAIDNTFRA